MLDAPAWLGDATRHRVSAATADRLRRRLAALPVAIDAVGGQVGEADLPSYPDGPRPTSTVILSGGGHAGSGEHVGWTAEVHARFLAAAARDAPRGRLTLGVVHAALGAAFPEAYDRAALEAAAIDLALRQRGASFAALADVAAEPVRYVVSYGPAVDPTAAIAAELGTKPALGVKLDVHADWSEASLAWLAETGAVAVLDWKGSGDVAAHERLHRVFPDAIVEDPAAEEPGGVTWSPSLRRRVSFDRPLAGAADLDRLPVEPVAINVKPARMGGVLEALDAIAAAGARGIAVYLGGMFEVGVGRAQLLRLASILCAHAPNDIAPIGRAGAPAPRPERLVAEAPEAPGFA